MKFSTMVTVLAVALCVAGCKYNKPGKGGAGGAGGEGANGRDITSEEFMCNNGILTVYDLGIISSLIESTRIKTENVCKIDCSVESTFIG